MQVCLSAFYLSKVTVGEFNATLPDKEQFIWLRLQSTEFWDNVHKNLDHREGVVCSCTVVMEMYIDTIFKYLLP